MVSSPHPRRFNSAFTALAASGLLLLALAALSAHTNDITHASAAAEPGSAAAAAGLGSHLRRLMQYSSGRPVTQPMVAPSYRPVATSSYTRPSTYR